MHEKLNSQKSSSGLGQVATHGAFWNILMGGANKVVTLLGQMAVAWILTPKDMGMAAMAMSMAGFTAFFGYLSVGDVLVQRGKARAEAGQGFWLSLFLGLSSGFMIFILAPISILMGHEEIFNILLVLSMFPLLDSLNPILTAFLKTDLNFKHLAISQFVSGVVYTLSVLILALLKFGPYSLILSVIPRTVAFCLIMLLKSGFPKFEKPRFRELKILVKPTILLSVSTFLTGLLLQAPVFFVGLKLDSTLTGYFSWGWAFSYQLVFLFGTNLRQVFMPVFSKMGNDFDRQIKAVLWSSRITGIFLTIICGMQSLVAESVIDNFFPQKWHQAGQVIVWISLGLSFQGFYVSIASWLNSVGRYKDLFKVTVGSVLFVWFFTYEGTILNGVVGAAIGNAVGFMSGMIFPLSLIPFNKLMSQWKKHYVPLVLSFVVWAILFSLNTKKLLLESCLCSLVFLLISILIWWKFSKEPIIFISNYLLEKIGLKPIVIGPKGAEIENT
jgi:O-antigen/teichoic acid export membrane protein